MSTIKRACADVAVALPFMAFTRKSALASAKLVVMAYVDDVAPLMVDQLAPLSLLRSH